MAIDLTGASLAGFNTNQVVQTSGWTPYPTITNTTTGQPQGVMGTSSTGQVQTYNPVNNASSPTPTTTTTQDTGPKAYDNSGDPAGFGDPNNPDLSNQYKRDRYAEYLAQQNASSEADRLRGEISSAWDAYINDIPNSMQYFNQQGDAMTGQADNFKTENLATLQDNKAQSLRDMQRTARAALQAGNNYLGQLGAGNSSARDMYSYAINKQQQQQQGELDRFSMAEERKINSQYQEQIFGIQQWLASQQQALVEAQRQGRLQKGLDLADISRSLLNNALQAVATAKQNAEARKVALMQWAADNSLNAGQLKANMAAIGQPMGQFQTYSASNPTAPAYSNSYTDEDRFI